MDLSSLALVCVTFGRARPKASRRVSLCLCFVLSNVTHQITIFDLFDPDRHCATKLPTPVRAWVPPRGAHQCTSEKSRPEYAPNHRRLPVWLGRVRVQRAKLERRENKSRNKHRRKGFAKNGQGQQGGVWPKGVATPACDPACF